MEEMKKPVMEYTKKMFLHSGINISFMLPYMCIEKDYESKHWMYMPRHTWA